jgi:RimJ/RimL family protein N-acetyltransferase
MRSVDRCVEQLQGNGYGLWAVEVRASGEFIGFVGLSEPRWEAAFTPCTEIGWRLARSAWGHGYATEAANEAPATAFGPAGLGEVVSFTTTRNVDSQRVMQRIGMTHDSIEDFDHPLVTDGPLRRHCSTASRKLTGKREGCQDHRFDPRSGHEGAHAVPTYRDLPTGR